MTFIESNRELLFTHYFPILRKLGKHQSLKEVSQRQVQWIQQWMNDYPRRILDYKTPHQAFVHELKQLDLELAA